MKFRDVQQSLEEFVKANWTATNLQYENVAFNADLYEEFTRTTVAFGETEKRSAASGCYRVTGLLMLTLFGRAASGSNRLLSLADTACTMLASVIVSPVPPLTAPKVQMLTPSVHKDFKERDGWIFVQVSCPFYYDLEL